MARNTEISWTNATWNPIRGCSPVSPGCKNCYASKVAKRFSFPGGPYEGLVRINVAGDRTDDWNGKINFIEKHLLDPLGWRNPQRVFVNSMSDLFHENVSDAWRDKIFAVMALRPQHTFQVLTKRPERMLAYLGGERAIQQVREAMIGMQVSRIHLARTGEPVSEWSGLPFPNVHLGVSTENQATADARIPLLLQTPAAKRFISAEPLLDELSIKRWIWPMHWHWDSKYRTPEEAKASGAYAELKPQGLVSAHSTFLDWVIVGGESGHEARPMHPQWARNMRDECVVAGVPFFFKQWGEWVSVSEVAGKGKHYTFSDGATVRKVGKKNAGALLDGKMWREFPRG